MKRLYFFALLAALPFLSFAGHFEKQFKGDWFNPHFNQTVKIKVKGNQLRIKGINPHHKWSVFTRSRNGTYMDCDGFVLKPLDRHRILISNRHYRTQKVFLREGYRHHFCPVNCNKRHVHNYYNDRGNHDHHHGRTDDFYGDEYGYNDDYYDRTDNLQKYEGTYTIQNSDRKVIVLNTRDGLKVKFRGSRDWVKYNQVNRTKHEFVNNQGDKLFVHRNGGLRWKKRNGFISLKLSKISPNTKD